MQADSHQLIRPVAVQADDVPQRVIREDRQRRPVLVVRPHKSWRLAALRAARKSHSSRKNHCSRPCRRYSGTAATTTTANTTVAARAWLIRSPDRAHCSRSSSAD